MEKRKNEKKKKKGEQNKQCNVAVVTIGVLLVSMFSYSLIVVV